MKDVYSQDIITLDFETTSYIIENGKSCLFDIEKANLVMANGGRYSKEVIPHSHLYIWGMTINGHFISGRTFGTLWNQLLKISNLKERKIIWIHNLAFEFQFLRNIISDFEIFARKPRQPMKAFSPSLNLEFRCTLNLTNLSLLKASEIYCPELLKKVGDLDYRKIRHSETILSEKEIDYLETDCLIVHKIIEKHMEEYGELNQNFPLTSTAKLRIEMKKRYSYREKNLIKDQLATDLEVYKKLVDSFSGGYTHANQWHVSQILENVKSYDIVSSYPSDMILQKFPMSKFVKSQIMTEKLDPKKAYILTVKFKNIKSIGYNNYLSVSKCLEKDGVITDNGRIFYAKVLKITITDIDFGIISNSYQWEDLEIIDKMESVYKPLPIKFIRYILELFKLKQDLKGIDGKEYDYAKAKASLNSLYGMLVTNVIKDEVVFEDNEWDIKSLSLEELQEILDKSNAPYKVYGNYAWGVWVTAYSRQKLWKVINAIDEDIIYCDTDSVKFIGNHDEIFEKINRETKSKRIDTAMRLKVDLSALQNIGDFEIDGVYYEFITLGAKKYGFTKEKDGKVNITISGVPKKASKAMKSLSDFKEGFVFDYSNSCKLDKFYNDHQEENVLIDDNGKEFVVKEKYGIALQPTTYILSEFPDFGNLNTITSARASNFSSENKIINELLKRG